MAGSLGIVTEAESGKTLQAGFTLTGTGMLNQVAGSNDVESGTVLRLDGTSYKYDLMANTATEAAEAAAVLLDDGVNISEGDQTVTIILSGMVHGADLVWPTGMTAGNYNVAVAALEDQGLFIDDGYDHRAATTVI